MRRLLLVTLCLVLFLMERAAPTGAPAPTSQTKCPVTDTMAISNGFYDTGSIHWAGQAGGMHNGVDFAGNPGEPVYAPFAMVVEDVGYYGDSGRIGYFIQARLEDGYLYYVGHLGEVWVSEGAYSPACTPLGTIGGVFHVHVKIASPDKPIPCEATGCDDFMAYWGAR